MNMQVRISAPQAADAGAILASRAMLASLSVPVWTARKYDKRVTYEVNESKFAAADAGRYNKALVAKDALSAVTAAATKARAYHESQTLPWLNDGTRILPAARFLDYSRRMGDLRAEFNAAVAEFLGNYSAFVEAARARLGDMWNESDYPAADAIARKFGFSVRVFNVPAGSDFRAEVPAAALAEVQAQIESAANEALAVAMREAWGRIAESVGRMAEKLSAYKPAAANGGKAEGIFRDSLVENVRELVALLPAFNLANDPELAAITARMESQLCAHDAESLREDDGLRAETAKAAAEIFATVSAYI